MVDIVPEASLSSLPEAPRTNLRVPDHKPPLWQRLQPMLVLDTLGAAFGLAFQYRYNIEWSAGHTRWAGENCHLALWKLPSSFRKSPSFSQKLLSSSDTPRRLASEDQGMTRVIPLHPPPFPTSGMSSFTDTLGRGREGMGMDSCPVALDLSPTALPPGEATCR